MFSTLFECIKEMIVDVKKSVHYLSDASFLSNQLEIQSVATQYICVNMLQYIYRV